MDPVELRGAGVRLRPWRTGDEPALVAACNDPLVRRWTGVPVPYDDGHARAAISRTAAGWADGTVLRWAVCDAATGEVLGDLAMRAAGQGCWDLGTWTSPGARGRGVATAAADLACRHAFTALGAGRVEWRAQPGNLASRRVAEKAGFRAEGVLRGRLARGPERADAWVASRLPDDPVVDTRALPGWTPVDDGVVGLRLFRSDDAGAVARAADADVLRWIPATTSGQVRDGAAYVEAQARAWADGTAATVAVVDLEEDRLLGSVGLFLRERAQGAGEVGYWTAPDARGRGVATAAVVLHTAWGLQVLGLERVTLWVDVANTASRRVAERAGFALEGVARAGRPAVDGRGRVDLAVYSVVA